MPAIDFVGNAPRRVCSILGFRKAAKAATASSSLMSSRAGASPRVHFKHIILDTLAFQRCDGLQLLMFFGGDVD
jgi:hypothetical protein